MNDSEKIIKLLADRSYFNVIVTFFELIAIIVGLVCIRKDKIGILFLSYLFFDLFILFFDFYIELLPSVERKQSNHFIMFTNALVSLIELLVYYHFFLKIIQNKVVARFMRIFRLFFTAVVVFFIATEFGFVINRYDYIVFTMETMEFVFLLLPCLAYFYEILQGDSSIYLFQRPSFWIVTGIFFFALISIPYYLIIQLLRDTHYEYREELALIFYYLPIAVNFIFLTKAFMLKKALTI